MTETAAPYLVEPAPPPPDQPVAPTFQQILTGLHERYPQCFPPPGATPKPLKIGIHKDVQARGLPEGVSATQLRRFLSGYTASFRYLKMLTQGGQRVDLDGNPAGVVTQEHIATAQERLAAKGTKKVKPSAPKPHAAALNALPVDSPLTPENTVPGKLEVTIKFNELPKPIQVQGGYKFGLDCDGRPVVVVLKPKHWNKLTAAAAEYAQWVAALTGKMGASEGKGFVLLEPALQVFEKAKAETAADSTPLQAASTPPAPAPSVAEPSALAKPKLSLKR